jgi:hypothetical protein
MEDIIIQFFCIDMSKEKGNRSILIDTICNYSVGNIQSTTHTLKKYVHTHTAPYLITINDQ